MLMKGVDGNIIFPGYEWAVIKLATVGVPATVEIDTCHFKGNFPESIYIEGLYIDESLASNATEDLLIAQFNADAFNGQWVSVLPRVKLTAHQQHHFVLNSGCKRINYIRVTMYPDGGISRVRLMGVRS